MILAPTSGPVGIQPHGHISRMVNKHSAALAIGDVVVTSFAHTNAVFPATTVAQQSLTPFSCVIHADGNSSTPGFIGVVIDLGSENGQIDSEVVVQFGGTVRAKVTATTANVVMGTVLSIGDAGGVFGNPAAATSNYPAAISLGSVTAGSTGTIEVLVNSALWYYADV